MKVKIVSHYSENDLKCTGESCVDLFLENELVYEGEDNYHHKINYKIEGFLDCLKSLKIIYELEEIELNDCSELND